MGVTHSVQIAEEREEEEEEEDEDEDEDEGDHNDNNEPPKTALDKYLLKKVLEQEPEMLPCYASASPLSPQLSSLGTPRLGPSIKVWDPYNVLAPLPPPPVFSRSFSSNVIDNDRVVMEVFLISHGECELNLKPDLISGRCPEARLTANGKRQARALAVFLKSQGVRFNSVYSSPLDRARSMAISVCQEMSIDEDQIQTSDSLTEMSQGDWDGCLRSEIYTPDTLSFIDRLQPDFSAPSGETLRQVEFRMVQFLVRTVLELSDKSSLEFSSHHLNDNRGLSHQISHALNNAIPDLESPSFQPPPSQWQPYGLSRKKYGKSRLQYVTTTGENDVEAENSPQDTSGRSSASSIFPCIGISTHSVPIKCLLTGLLGCSPLSMHKFVIEDSSVTVLQHSLKTGWQIKRLNETAHLRLL